MHPETAKEIRHARMFFATASPISAVPTERRPGSITSAVRTPSFQLCRNAFTIALKIARRAVIRLKNAPARWRGP